MKIIAKLGFILLLSFCSITLATAKAYNPSGSYKITCSGCSTRGSVLTCSCSAWTNFGTQHFTTSIDMSTCPSQNYSNSFGALSCN